jgi:hypothetical protein
MKDNNEDLRKLSCKILLEILNNNEVLQNIFCEKFNFNPIGNVICINWLPRQLKENIKIDERVITEIKNSFYPGGKTTKYWLWPGNGKYTDDIIPDPQKYLIGFYYANKNVIYILITMQSYFNMNTEDKMSDDRIDTRLLTTKLENDFIEETNQTYGVAAGSGSESSAKINERDVVSKDKYFVTGNLFI